MCVCVCSAGVEASEFIDSQRSVDLMLLDIRMPMRTGLEVMQACVDHLPSFPVVCMHACTRLSCDFAPR